MRGLILIATLLVGVDAAAGDPLTPRPNTVIVAHEQVGETPVLGPLYAPVTGDFFINLDLDTRRTLPMHTALVALAKRHPRRLRVVYRLVGSSGRTMITEAAMEAFAQGRFWPFMDELARWRRGRVPRAGQQLRQVCERAGVDYQAIEDAWADGRHLRVIEDNALYRRRRRVHRAPSLLLNGAPTGIRASMINVGRLESVYDAAYEEARHRLDDGVPLRWLYEFSLREIDTRFEPIPISVGAIDGVRLPEDRGPIDAPALFRPVKNLGGHVLGPPDASVTVRVFCNFLSTNCSLLQRTLQQLRSQFPREVRLVFHHMFPSELKPDRRSDLLLIHQAALCADREGAFWAFHDDALQNYLLRRQRSLSVLEQLEEIAKNTELDYDDLQACMNRKSGYEELTALLRAGAKAGVSESPTVVVAGRIYPGSKSMPELRSLVERELLPGILERFAPTYHEDVGLFDRR